MKIIFNIYVPLSLKAMSMKTTGMRITEHNNTVVIVVVAPDTLLRVLDRTVLPDVLLVPVEVPRLCPCTILTDVYKVVVATARCSSSTWLDEQRQRTCLLPITLLRRVFACTCALVYGIHV